MATYKTPGVYVEEKSIFPPSVAQVETAIPAFIGYPDIGDGTEPTKITSMVEYQDLFGGPADELPSFTIESNGNVNTDSDISTDPTYKMYYMLQMYFANGGGPCYIISVGSSQDSAPIEATKLRTGLTKLNKEDEPTLIVFPDAANIDDDTAYHDLYKDAMSQCASRGDRFAICDVLNKNTNSSVKDSAEQFRSHIGINNLEYGAAYYPNLKTSLSYEYAEKNIRVTHDGDGAISVLRNPDSEIDFDDPNDAKLKESLFHANNGEYRSKYYQIKQMIDEVKLVLPPSSAVAGAYATVDRTRGVWKSPANISLNRVTAPTVLMERSDQDGLNVSASDGKSINAIRSFTGKGTLIWGARTLDGNSNEWCYISVRRFFNMVEESVKKATGRFVFEPNDANTWVKVKAMIENFLTLQWRDGALMGAKTDQAFYVKVGLGETMTQQDVLDGKMIIEIGMAVVRPAEFIVLRFSHKMMES